MAAGESVAPPGAPPSTVPGRKKKLLVLAIVAVVVVAVLSLVVLVLLTAPTVARFEVTASAASPFTGQAFTLTVRAVLPDGATDSGYQGEVVFTSDDLDATLPGPTRLGSEDRGAKVFPDVVIRKVGSITITVRDPALGISGSVALTGQRAPDAPVAAFEATRTLMHVKVNASATTDPDNNIVSYDWDFESDGTFDATGITADRDYVTPGPYRIRLRVTDSPGNEDFAARRVSVGPSTLDVTIWDMFNVSYREWWDYRFIYGDFPLGADCFSFESIPPTRPDGSPSPNPDGSGACDKQAPGYTGETWVQYPYVNPIAWVGDRKNIQIYTSYRMTMVGVNQPGATLAQPVYLPVLNATEPAGTTLRLTWDFSYLRKAEAQAVDNLCGSSSAPADDGFIAQNIFTVTMDLQESKRIFGVVGTTPAEAQAWWAGSELVRIGGQDILVPRVDPDCSFKGVVEDRWEDFMVAQGGLPLVMGSYDLYSSWEWYYQPFVTNLYPTNIDPVTGETTVLIDHVVFGTEVLFARWFHWGPTLYLDPGPDGKTGSADDIINAEIYPHNARGWWKWELAWFSDLHFDTAIGATDQDFTLDTVMDYHMDAYADPGPDGVFHSLGPDLRAGTADDIASTDDIAAWTWMPVLTDYAYGGTVAPGHTVSELDPYAGPDGKPGTADDLRYYYGRPGQVYFGTQYRYDLVPAEWDLAAGDTVVVRVPTTNVRCVDPYSPLTSDADGSDLILPACEIGFLKSTPALPSGSEASDSDGDGIMDTVGLYGPIDWGAPAQPLWGTPALEFTAVSSGALASSASIAVSSESVNGPAGSAVGPFGAVLPGPQALAIGLFMVVVYAPWIRPRSGGGWSRAGRIRFEGASVPSSHRPIRRASQGVAKLK